MIALDDDLWRHRSKSVVADGATQINNPKKGMGVVHHAAVSVTTGIYCGGYVQHRGDTTMLCVTNVQQILCSAISTNEMHLNGTIFFMDRGYGGTDGEIVQSLIQRGGNIHGTAKRMRSFPYTYGQENVGPNQVLVSESGAYSVYESYSYVTNPIRIIIRFLAVTTKMTCLIALKTCAAIRNDVVSDFYKT